MFPVVLSRFSFSTPIPSRALLIASAAGSLEMLRSKSFTITLQNRKRTDITEIKTREHRILGLGVVKVLFCPEKKKIAVFQTKGRAVRPKTTQEQLLLFGHKLRQYILSHFFLSKLE